MSGSSNRLAGETVFSVYCMVVPSQVYCTLSMVYVFILQVARYDQNIWSKNPIACRAVGQTGHMQEGGSPKCTPGSSSQDGYHVVGCTL